MNKKKEIVPRLRFPEFNNSKNWDITHLNVIADKITVRNKNNDINRVFTNSAIDGVVDQEDYFDRNIANQNNLLNYFIVEKGDYVYNPRISASAPVGPISKNKLGIGVMSPLYTVFRFKNKDNDFYEQFFLTNLWHEYIKSLSNMGTRHDRITISVDDFMKMPLPCASPEEQQKIADCLSSIDELIDAESRKLEALKKYKKGLMQKLFPSEGKTLPKWRFPEFIGYKWNGTKLGKISSIVREKAGKKKYLLMSVTSGVGLIPQIEKFGREIAGDSYKNYTVIRKYDFAYNKSATKQFPEGYISMLSEYDVAAVPNSIFICFQIIDSECYPLFFDYLFQNNYHGQWLRKYIEVGARAHGSLSVDTKHLWSMPIVLPCFEEQQKIAVCLSSIDELIDAESRKLEALKKYKKGLIQGIFPSLGEVNV